MFLAFVLGFLFISAGRSGRSFSDSGIGSSIGSRNYSTQNSIPSSFTQGSIGTGRAKPAGKAGNKSRNNSSFNSNSSFMSSQQTRNFSNNSTSDFNMGSTQNSRAGSNRLPLATVTGNAVNCGNEDSGNAVVCNCGSDAVLLTVRKEGPNTGRQFYKCGGSSCNFFLWADEAGNNMNDRDSSSNFNNR